MTWFMAHPWMTLIITIILIIAITDCIANICNVFIGKYRTKQFEIMSNNPMYTKEDIVRTFNKKDEDK